MKNQSAQLGGAAGAGSDLVNCMSSREQILTPTRSSRRRAFEGPLAISLPPIVQLKTIGKLRHGRTERPASYGEDEAVACDCNSSRQRLPTRTNPSAQLHHLVVKEKGALGGLQLSPLKLPTPAPTPLPVPSRLRRTTAESGIAGSGSPARYQGDTLSSLARRRAACNLRLLMSPMRILRAASAPRLRVM